MAIKKSALYRSIWDSCNELRGGMDASQYKDYVLTLSALSVTNSRPERSLAPSRRGRPRDLLTAGA